MDKQKTHRSSSSSGSSRGWMRATIRTCKHSIWIWDMGGISGIADTLAKKILVCFIFIRSKNQKSFLRKYLFKRTPFIKNISNPTVFYPTIPSHIHSSVLPYELHLIEGEAPLQYKSIYGLSKQLTLKCQNRPFVHRSKVLPLYFLWAIEHILCMPIDAGMK